MCMSLLIVMYYGDLYKIAATIISDIAKISPLKVLAVTSRPLASKNSIPKCPISCNGELGRCPIPFKKEGKIYE